MKAFRMAIVLCLAIPAFLPGSGIDFQLDVCSRYIWRGFDLNPDNRPVIQPSLDFSLGNSRFSVNLWGSFSFYDRDLEELDVTLTYQFKTGKNIDLSVGIAHYGWYFSRGFSFADHSSQELFVSLRLPEILLTPSFSIYWDIHNGDGLYVLLSLESLIKINASHSMVFATSLGYNHHQWVGASGLSDLNFTLSFPLLMNKIHITPYVKLTFVFLDEVNPRTGSESLVGVSITWD